MSVRERARNGRAPRWYVRVPERSLPWLTTYWHSELTTLILAIETVQAVAHYRIESWDPRTGDGYHKWTALLSAQGKTHAWAWYMDGPSRWKEVREPDLEWVEAASRQFGARGTECPQMGWHDPETCSSVRLEVVDDQQGTKYPEGWR